MQTSPATADDQSALGDIRVLELGSMLAGPFVGSLLGDFGARVVKVEKPGKPDALREWPPHKADIPLWWKTMARNKHAVTLDISRPEAREIVLRLIGESDIVIENFRPGTMERWGLSPNELRDIFPLSFNPLVLQELNLRLAPPIVDFLILDARLDQ